jgi:hypothetical protein
MSYSLLNHFPFYFFSTFLNVTCITHFFWFHHFIFRMYYLVISLFSVYQNHSFSSHWTKIFLFLLLELQSFVNFSFFQNSPLLFSVLLLTSSVPDSHFLPTSLYSHRPTKLSFCHMQSAFWIKNSKFSAWVQFMHSKELSQPPQSS